MSTTRRMATQGRLRFAGALAALVAVAVLAACPRAQGPVAPLAPPTPDQVVTAANRVLELYEQAYEVVSATALMPPYLGGVDTTLVVQGQPHRGSSGVRAYVDELFGRVQSFRIDLGTVSVSALGDDAAEVTAEIKREYTDGPATIVENGILTLTLSRFGDKWLIRTEHYSYGR